jgi:NitT/TauT family transport system substrate-binding protein
MRRLLYLLTAVVLIGSCGESYEEKRRISHKRRMQLMREDSAALKVAVVPTIDCLPLLVAKSIHLFDTLGADVRLKFFTAQMDCDTAVMGGSVQGVVTDLVRAERMISKGTPLEYVTSTTAYWQLYTGRMARIKTLRQLDDKMVGMTRYSATDLLSDLVRDSAKIDKEKLFKIQLNNVHIRLQMLINTEIDAVWLQEPQATQARLMKHHPILDSRKTGLQMGVIAFRSKDLQDSTRRRQLDVLKRGYNMACDTLARYGIDRYKTLLVKLFKMTAAEVDSLPKNLKFTPIAEPQAADIERARKWLKQQ